MSNTYPIVIYQAPTALLAEHDDLYLKMHNPNKTFTDTVPAQYYLPVFNGEITAPEEMPTAPEEKTASVLEHIFFRFNQPDRPNPRTSRSLSVGDVVFLDGQFYLCAVFGFTPVKFDVVDWEKEKSKDGPVGRITMPDGTKLVVSIYQTEEYPSIDIDLIKEGGDMERICFVEHNQERAPGQQLCVCIYEPENDEPIYYESYAKKEANKK